MYCLYNSLGSDMRFFVHRNCVCKLTILIATKGSSIAQLRYQKREKAVSLISSLYWVVLKLSEPRGSGDNLIVAGRG